MRITAFKKKLYKCRPDRKLHQVETYQTKTKVRQRFWDVTSLEREVRQLLSDKVSGTMMGLWLLIPEHLRLGTWDLLRGWTGKTTSEIEPRLALQQIHEAALCVTGVRESRSLSQKGFELTNGLPFVASDQAIHELLNHHTVAEAETLQRNLGLLRRARKHFVGKILAIDPHRTRSYSKRQMCRYRGNENIKPYKMAQTFFCIDADSHEPVCLITASSSRTVTQASPSLLKLAAEILNPVEGKTLVLADTEHYTSELVDHVTRQTPFDLLMPMPNGKAQRKFMKAIPDDEFTPRWAGFATAKTPYTMTKTQTGPHWALIQRSGERPEDYVFKGFLATRNRDEVQDLAIEFPKRWHVEEFFNANQALGWNRAGTLNLNVRYGQMTMALVAEAVIYQLRQRLGKPFINWDASHLAKAFFRGLDGDIRTSDDTIIVTFYNAQNTDHLRQHYEGLPDKLSAEGIDPRVPWLYNYKLDFRFK